MTAPQIPVEHEEAIVRRADHKRIFAISLLLQASGALLAYALQIVLAKELGAASYGAMATFISMATIAGLVGTFGTGSLGLSSLPKLFELGDNRSARSYVTFAFGATLAASLGIGAVTSVIVPLKVHGASITMIAAFVVFVSTTSLASIGSDIGRALGRLPSTYGAYLIVRPLGAMIAVTLILTAGGSKTPEIGLVALVVGGLVAVGAQLWSIGAGVGYRLAIPTRQRRRHWIREAPHYMLANIFVLLLSQIDIVVTSFFLSNSQVGRYAAAARTASGLTVVSVAISGVIVPRFASNAEPERRTELQRQADTSTRLTFLLSLGAALPVIVLASPILSIFGTGFSSASWPLRIILIGQLVNTGLGPGGSLLVYTGRPRYATAGYAVCVFLAGAVCAVGASLFGLVGAAIGNGVGIAVVGILMFVLAGRTTGVWSSVATALRWQALRHLRERLRG